MATREIIALDEATPQLLAPQAGDTYLAPRPVGISVGTLTTDQKPLDISATFNNAAVTFTGLKLNVTDTASASGSLLLDVQKGGVSQLVLDKGGRFIVGTTAPAGSSQITAYGASNGQIAVQNSTNWSRLLQNAGDLYVDNGVGGSGGNTIFRAGSGTVERMRLDASGNLGLGATSTTGYWPANLTQTSARAAIYYDDSTTNLNNANAGLVIVNSNSAANTSSKLVFGAYNADPVPVGLAYISATNSSRVSAYLSGSLIFGTAAGGGSGATERMRLDSSGNLGLGVTPSAWGSGIAALQLKNGPAWWAFDASSGYLVQNAYYDGSTWRYTESSSAGYLLTGGAFRFFTAGSGTAGNAVTFTERASIDASSFVINEPGNNYDTRIEGDTDANLFFVDASTDRVGIGTNAPNVKLEVNSGANAFSTGSLRVQANTYPNIEFYSSNADANNRNWRISSVYNAFGVFEILSSTTAGGSPTTSRLAIDSSGNLGLGTSTFGTSAAGVFAVKNGTAPTTGPADTIQIYSSDVSAGNTTLSIYTEGTPVSDSTDNAVTKKIAVRINGTLYYLLADTDNS